MATENFDYGNPAAHQRFWREIHSQPELSHMRYDPIVGGVTWLCMHRIDGEPHVILEKCPKKREKLGVGTWFVPGGKIEGEESALAAVLREITEEWPKAIVQTCAPLPLIEGSRVPPSDDALDVFLMRPFVITLAPDSHIGDFSADGIELRWFSVRAALQSPVVQVRMMVAAAMAYA